jgi:hypothetical protein
VLSCTAIVLVIDFLLCGDVGSCKPIGRLLLG